MGKQPSAIIIVRHGTRLDQTDKNWRATAEHPYDPPLSYGGWIQCQTLGARIDKELQSLDNQVTPQDLEREENGLETQRPKKKRKIIIHSSPYKRCIQTSIAIAAGLRYPQPDKVQRPLLTPFQRTSLSRPVPSDPVRASVSSNGDIPRSQPTTDTSPLNEKIDLKVDQYLAEWLSPSYFEDSKVPPSIDAILDRAKETLQRPLQEIRGADLSAFVTVPESPAAEDMEKENAFGKSYTGEKGGLRGMAAAGHSLPHRNRTTSFGKDLNNPPAQPVVQKIRQRARATTYSPPVPQYSLAPQDPIPAGYVAHARDFCVEPDLEWDSEKMGWGDAGTYPEEWSTMHVRFRQGLQKTLAYYQIYKALQIIEENGEESEEEEDIVLVLVTHQAGANALIRLMTGAPALHDVGVASLTLAVRRPVLRRPPSLSGTSHSPLGYDREHRKHSRRGSLDLGLADDYEMRIIASTEHLRFGSNPLGLNSPRLGRSPAIAGRKMVGAESLEGFSIGDPLSWRPNSSSGVSRSSSQRGRTTETVARPAINTGLWGSPAISASSREPIDEGIEDLEAPMSPRSRPSTPAESERSVPESKLSSPSRSRSSTMASPGLWGASNPIVNVRTASGESWGSTNSGLGVGGTWGTVNNNLGAGGTWGSAVGPGGSIARARSPAKRRWTAVTSSP